MPSIFPRLFICAVVCIIFSCGGKNKKDQPGPANQPDSVSNNQPVNNQVPGNTADSTLAPVKQVFEKELSHWVKSFSGFHVDSFKLTQNTGFEQTDYNETGDIKDFYALYRPSLNFSPDSSWFIDLYSAGVMLEKKGKKIIASADVDQAVTLCDLRSKEWKRIVSFGPSAGIEEAVWITPSAFVLAGTMQNDNGVAQPIILLGDVNSKSFRWFEANAKRPESSNYEASGLGKLKIDEWE